MSDKQTVTIIFGILLVGHCKYRHKEEYELKKIGDPRVVEKQGNVG